jgi:hypothetical protein
LVSEMVSLSENCLYEMLRLVGLLYHLDNHQQTHSPEYMSVLHAHIWWVSTLSNRL